MLIEDMLEPLIQTAWHNLVNV